MRYQDLDAATDLLEVADDADSGHLTLARVGEDRRESQVSSQPLASFTELLDWFHAAVRRTEPGQDGVKLRLRLWGGDRRAIRSVTFRAWDDPEPEQPEPPPGEAPSTALALVPASEPAVSGPAPAPAPRPAPCPACTLLQSHLAAARMEASQLDIELRRCESRLWQAEQRLQQAQALARQLDQAQRRSERLSHQLADRDRQIRRLQRANAQLEDYQQNAEVVLAAYNSMDVRQ